jgi:hypothetical protein
MTISFYFVEFFVQPLMKDLINLGSQFIGFRNEAAILRGKTCTILSMFHVSAKNSLPSNEDSLSSVIFFF